MFFKNRTFCWFAWLLSLFVSSAAFAQDASYGESSGVIQMFIGILNDYVGGAANLLFSIFFFDFGSGLAIDHYCAGRWWRLLLFLFWLDYVSRIQTFAQCDSRAV